MASNPYVNKVQNADGTTIIDISDTTAVASDVASGKYFYLATGQKVQGSGGGGGSPTLITKNITSNGTYDAEDDNADGYSSVTVNVSGGGGSTLLYSTEVSASTTSTSATKITTLHTGITFQLGKVYSVVIRDKAGKKNGYSYGTDCFFLGYATSFASSTSIGGLRFGVNSDGTYNYSGTLRGVYAYKFYGGSSTMGNIDIYARYDSSNGTINGTYTVKVYEMENVFGIA